MYASTSLSETEASAITPSSAPTGSVAPTPAPTTSRTAAATRSGPGTYRSSRFAANGGGECGAVTILGAARSAEKQFCATSATMSLAIEQRGYASSTTTSRPVLSTDS